MSPHSKMSANLCSRSRHVNVMRCWALLQGNGSDIHAGKGTYGLDAQITSSSGL